MEILYKKNRTEKILISIIVAVLVVLFAILTSIILKFNLVQNLVMSWVLTTLYSLFAFFFIEPAKISVNKVIEKPVIKEVSVYTTVPVENKTIEIVERPIIKEVPVYTQIPIENRIIEVVEKQVIKEIPVEVVVEKKVYVEKSKKKLAIPHFKFIASTQTKRYHTRFCRLGKLVKKKFKIHSNSQAFFKKKNFKACKKCVKKN